MQVLLAKVMTNQDTCITRIPVALKERILSGHTIIMFIRKGSSVEGRHTCITDPCKSKEAILCSFLTMASFTYYMCKACNVYLFLALHVVGHNYICIQTAQLCHYMHVTVVEKKAKDTKWYTTMQESSIQNCFCL